MEQVVSFKTRVKNSAIENARYFNELFVKYDYLIFTEAVESLCFEVKATEGNYLHLVGVSTPLTPVIFFQKCLDGSLQETDFSFNKAGVSSSSLKGTVREKIQALDYLKTFFSVQLIGQENFVKNQIEARYAASDQKMTLCFTRKGNPKSLLRKNKLEAEKSREFDLILRKKSASNKESAEALYSDIIFNNHRNLDKYKNIIVTRATNSVIDEIEAGSV